MSKQYKVPTVEQRIAIIRYAAHSYGCSNVPCFQCAFAVFGTCNLHRYVELAGSVAEMCQNYIDTHQEQFTHDDIVEALL